MYRYMLNVSAIFTKRSNIRYVLFASFEDETLPKGSPLKGRNLLLEEQILSFKSRLPVLRNANIKKRQRCIP